VAGHLARRVAAAVLDVTVRTLRRYLRRYRQRGADGLRDRRGGPRPRFTLTQAAASVDTKRAGPQRSARKIRDRRQLPLSLEAVRQVLIRHGLARLGRPPVQPIQRFVAAAPNALWQIAILGQGRSPLLGARYLSLARDDHSRFTLTGGFFLRTCRIHLFTVMSAAVNRWGLPQARLSDRESQCKSTNPLGAADYPYSARRVGIERVDARRARTKGKIERRFRFLQHDFGLAHLDVTSAAALTGACAPWVEADTFSHARRALAGAPPAAQYVPSLRRLTPAELALRLVHEEPRKVARTGTISYSGRHYRVPDPYIGRRVWTRLKGDRLTLQVGRTTLAEYTLDSEPRT